MSADYQGEIRAGAGRGAGEDIALRCDRALRTSDELAKLPELRWTSNGARGCSACVATLPQVGAATVAARARVAPDGPHLIDNPLPGTYAQYYAHPMHRSACKECSR
jgi:hypothetical protein